MRRPLFTWFSVALLACAALCGPAAATTYMRMSDRALSDQAAAVADVKVVGVEPAPFGGAVATDYLVEVNRMLKGSLPGSTVVVRVPGGVGADGLGLKIWGAPEFAEGERALLFLIPGHDGAYRILHLMLGAFHERTTKGGLKVAVRDLSEAHAVGDPGPEPLRDFEKFADWVVDRDLGLDRPAGYLLPAGSALAPQRKFVLLQATDGFGVRWFRFDNGDTIDWRVNSAGQPGLSLDDTIGALQTALATWTNDAATNIRYSYVGTTDSQQGLVAADNVNALLFNDPYAGQEGREVMGTFDCSQGGIIAIGGPWFFSSTRPYAGKQFHEAVEADIVTNDGTECLFHDNRKVAEEVFTHELGHTLGLGHSLVRDAIMFASIHNDGRGSRLNPDDVAAIATLYRSGGGPPPAVKKPAPPTNLAAHATSTTEATLTWRDKSNNEDGFSIEIKEGRGGFQVLGSVGADETSANLSGLSPGVSYTLRVRAFNSKGSSAYTKSVVLRMPRG